jgi:drug/metabolite transporter (DMT)-like permease
MRISSILSFIGFVLIFAGTYCPLLRPFGLFNWNVYQLNQPYGLVMLLVAVIGIAASFLNQPKIIRAAAWIATGLVVMLYIAAFLKIHFTFSFIPFHRFEAFLARQVKFKWGWYVLFAGVGFSLGGALKSKPKKFIKNAEFSS